MIKPMIPQQLVHYTVPENADCLSIYANGPEELKELLAQARDTAQDHTKAKAMDRLAKPIMNLLLTNPPPDSSFPTAFFSTKGFSGYTPLPFSVKGMQVFSNSFHIKPLLKWLQREHPFSLLLLGDKSATLFQGTLTGIRGTETLDYKELRTFDGVFSALDRAVYRTVQSTRTPLILAGNHDLIENYRNISGYRAILDESIVNDGSLSSIDNLHREAVRVLEPYLERREDQFIEKFRNAERNGMAAGSLQDVVHLALKGKVKLLLVSEAVHLWGYIDKINGTFSYRPGKRAGGEDDILDDLSEIVIRKHGNVAILPSYRMPGGRVACAILRGMDPFWKERRGKNLEHEEMMENRLAI